LKAKFVELINEQIEKFRQNPRQFSPNYELKQSLKNIEYAKYGNPKRETPQAPKATLEERK